MAKQYRGCSHLYYAVGTEGSNGVVTYGTPKVLAPVKSVSRDIASENEAVYADNTVYQRTYGATSVTRTFETVRIDPTVVAEILGDTTQTISGVGTARLTNPDASARPILAIGYALHDGDVDKPCELVWAYNCKVNSISKSASTIDDGTGSEGQSVEIVNNAPKQAWTETGKRNLDFDLPVDEEATAVEVAALVTKFFTQVVTPDNASTVLA